MYEQREFALAGGLMSYGTNLPHGYRQALLLAGPEHGRTSAARLAAIPAGESPANRGVQSLL